MGFFKKKTTTERINELLAAGRMQDATNLCQQVCGGSDATPQEWLLYGSLSADRGDLNTARNAFVKATELDDKLAVAHFRLGKVLATAGEHSAALDSLQKAAQLQPENPDIWLALGITCGLAQDMIRAEEYCRRSLNLRPESAYGRFNLANTLQAQGKLTEAETEYEAALQLDPKMVAGWSMLAQTRFSLHKFAEAKVAATQALTLNPRMGEAHYTLGCICEALNDRELARDHLRQAVEMLPNLIEAHTRLGEVLFSLEDYAGATPVFQSAVNLDPALQGAHFRMGECFEELGLLEGAMNCFQQVVALNGDHLPAHYKIAMIASRVSRNDKAAIHFAEVLRLNPRDDQARHLLAASQGQSTATAPAAYVRTLFDGFAETFDEKLVGNLGYRTPEILCNMVNDFVSPASSQLDVIDLGCGTGLCALPVRGMARTLHGVDLAPLMIEKARERGLYDSLEVNDVASSLNSREAAWDLAIASDVFVYVGDLREIFVACATALRSGGMFAFSVEADDEVATYTLRSTGRYAHAANYIQELSTETGFSVIESRAEVLRKDKGNDINGHLFLLQR